MKFEYFVVFIRFQLDQSQNTQQLSYICRYNMWRNISRL